MSPTNVAVEGMISRNMEYLGSWAEIGGCGKRLGWNRIIWAKGRAEGGKKGGGAHRRGTDGFFFFFFPPFARIISVASVDFRIWRR